MKKLQLLLVLIFGITCMTSCGSDVDCSDTSAIEAEIDPLANLYVDALLAFGLDQSADNCSALEDALKDLIDKSKDFQDCVDEADRAEYDQGIADLETQLDALSC